MDWIKQNRFLAGFLGVLIGGALLLGAFLFLSWKGYKDTMASYEERDAQVTALEKKKIFPNAKHLAEKTSQVEDYGEAVDALQAKAITLQRPLNKGLSERNFRDKMNQMAEEVATLAEAKKLGIPDEFALGMEKYRDGAAVNPKAVPLLDWEMQAIRQLVGHIADAGIDSIDDLIRDEFPMEDRDWDPVEEAKKREEAAKAAARDAARSRGRSRGRGRSEEAAPVVSNPMETAAKVMETYRVRIRLGGSYEALQTALNQIAADDSYFTWVRQLRIENVTKDSPLKGAVPGAIPIANAPVGPDGQQAVINAHVLFGNEKMVADLFIDFVRFDDSSGASAADTPADETASAE